MSTSSANSTQDVSRGPVVALRRGGMFRNIIHLSMGQVATTVLAILLSAAIARTLGASEFGLLYLVTTIGTFAYVFIDWGHGPYVIREIARNPALAGELAGSVMAVRAATAVLICVPVVATTWLLGYDRVTIALGVTIILAWLPAYLAMTYSWVFRGCERMDYDALLNVVMKLCTLLLSLVVLALGGRVLSLILLSILNGLVTLALGVALYRRLHLSPLRVTSATAYELLRDGAPMLAMSVAVAVQPSLNANLLYKLAPIEVVGWYGVAWTIAGTLVAPSVILGGSVYPRFSRAAGDLDELRRVLRTTSRPLMLVAVLGAVGTYLFADVAIGLIYGKQRFAQAADTLRMFAPVLLLIYADMLFGDVVYAMARVGRLVVAKVAAVLVTTALAFVLIPFCQARYGNGGIGIMIATGAGELLIVSSMLLLVREVVERRLFIDGFRAMVAGGATLLLMRALPALTPILAIPLCIVVFLGLSFALGVLNRADVDLLFASLRRNSPGGPDAAPQDTLAAAQEPPVSPAETWKT